MRSPAASPTAPRAAMLERWAALTREVLPDMAVAHLWPIRLDHCFMRVCLDAAVDAPWPTVVARPAVRHLSDEQLARAVAVAESIVADPGRIHALNERSIGMRRAARSGQGGTFLR